MERILKGALMSWGPSGEGKGGGGGSSELDKYITLDTVQDILKSTKAIEVPKFKVGEIQAVVSGIENILFRNELTGTSWAPVRQGIKNQKLASNRGPEGLIEPTFRSYSPTTETITTGALGGSNVEAKVNIEMTANRSINGIGLYPAKAYKANETIYLKTFYGEDTTGIPVNSEPYTFAADHSAGAGLIVWLSYPVDVKHGTRTYFEVVDTSGAVIDTRSISGSGPELLPYFCMYHREFSDKIIRGAAKPELTNMSSTLDGDHDITTDLNTTQSFTFTAYNTYAITGTVELFINGIKYVSTKPLVDGPNLIQYDVTSLVPEVGDSIIYSMKYHDVYGKIHETEVEAGHWIEHRMLYWGVREDDESLTINPKDLWEVPVRSSDYFSMLKQIPEKYHLMILAPIEHELTLLYHEGHKGVNALSAFKFAHNARLCEGLGYSTYVLRNEGAFGTFSYTGRVK